MHPHTVLGDHGVLGVDQFVDGLYLQIQRRELSGSGEFKGLVQKMLISCCILWPRFSGLYAFDVVITAEVILAAVFIQSSAQ